MLLRSSYLRAKLEEVEFFVRVLNLRCTSSVSLVQGHSSVFHSNVWERRGASIADFPVGTWMFMQMPHKMRECTITVRQGKGTSKVNPLPCAVFRSLCFTEHRASPTVTARRQAFWRHPATDL